MRTACSPGAVRGGTLNFKRILSTHLFLQHRLHPGLLEVAQRAEVAGVEIFAARHHFDYTNNEEVQELAGWFRSNPLKPYSIHAPLYPDLESGRAGAPGINLIHTEKSRRIMAMDEMKRALETAERIPFETMIVHLGERVDPWSTETLEHAWTALEHLGAFARPLGVKILVENLLNEATLPEHLNSILTIGHLDGISVCLDTGHAHITVGVQQAIATLGNRIVNVHVHDNHGEKDEHLWPGMGSIDWPGAMSSLADLATPPALVLEIHPTQAADLNAVPAKVQDVFESLKK